MNHLWQSSAFAILAAILAFALRRSPAKVRYWIWLSASLKFLVPLTPLITLGTLLPHPTPRVTPVAPAILTIAEPFTPAVYSAAPAENEPNWLGILWTLGFLAIVLARCRSWLKIQTALRSAIPVELPIPIRAVVAKHATEPGIVGFLRPVLLLPPRLTENLNSKQLSALLAHEMCHVRRRDNFFAAIHMLVEAIFWFNPLVWWIGSRMVEERERACDEEVLRTGCEPADYVEGILQVCRLCRESPLPCVSGVTGADVKKRLRTILSGTIVRDWTAGKKIALATAGLVTLATPVIIGVLNAAPAPLRFEAASVKAVPDSVGWPPRAGYWVPPRIDNPQRFRTRTVLLQIIAWAWGVRDFQVSGGPAWLKQGRFEILSTAQDPATETQMKEMLQALLADRFQLQFHWESKEMPVYALVVTRNSPQLAPAKNASSYEGNGRFDVGNGIVMGHGATMAGFSQILTDNLERPVVDRTGLAGRYDFKLAFEPSSPSPSGWSPIGAALFTPIRDLGLKLEAQNDHVEILVIDSVERPSDN